MFNKLLQIILSFFNNKSEKSNDEKLITNNTLVKSQTEIQLKYQELFKMLKPGVPASGSPFEGDKLKKDIDVAVNHIIFGRQQYEKIEVETKVPWWFIGLLHYRESTCNFNTHLHNGDPLSAKTKHVPAGRPEKGNPPFSFVESAIDALTFEGFTKNSDWRIGSALDLAEKYNGLGYRKRKILSPYLFGGSDIQQPGKYVSDGVFNNNVWDKQIGIATILKRMIDRGVVTI